MYFATDDPPNPSTRGAAERRKRRGSPLQVGNGTRSTNMPAGTTKPIASSVDYLTLQRVEQGLHVITHMVDSGLGADNQAWLWNAKMRYAYVDLAVIYLFGSLHVCTSNTFNWTWSKTLVPVNSLSNTVD